MVTTQARRVQPGQLVQGRATVRNTGNVPAFLGVRVVSGSADPLGFSPRVSPVVVSTPIQVRPGETAEVLISVRVPDAPGLADFQLEVGTLGPGGNLSRILDRQTLRGLAEVLRDLATSATPAPPDLADLSPAQRLAQFRDNLGTPSISASPREVQPGQTVRIFYQFPSRSPFPYSPRLRLQVMDHNNIPVRTPLDQQVTFPQEAAYASQVDVNTTNLPQGRSYGVGFSLTDPLTGTNILEPLQRANLFRIATDGVPEIPPPPDFERIEPITNIIPEVPPLPAVRLQPAGSPSFTPSQVRPGDSVAVSLPVNIPSVFIAALPESILDLQVDLYDPQGNRHLPPLDPRRQTVRAGSMNMTHSVRIPSDAPPGRYDVYLSVWNTKSPRIEDWVVFEQRFSNAFEVLAPAAPASPAAPAAPTPPALVGPPAAPLMTVGTPSLTPATVVRGNLLTGSWTLRNTRSQRIRAFLHLEGPAGLRGTGVPQNIEPGESNTVRVIERVPPATLPGSAAYRMEVRDASTNQLIANLRETRTITVTREPEPEPPPPSPTAGGFIAGNISLVATGPMTPSVSAGDTVQIQHTLRNNSTRSGTVEIQAFGRDAQGNTRGSGRTTATLAPQGTANPRVSLNIPSGAPPGSYGVRVFVWDPRTFVAGDPSTYLVQRTDSGIFTVRS